MFPQPSNADKFVFEYQQNKLKFKHSAISYHVHAFKSFVNIDVERARKAFVFLILLSSKKLLLKLQSSIYIVCNTDLFFIFLNMRKECSLVLNPFTWIMNVNQLIFIRVTRRNRFFLWQFFFRGLNGAMNTSRMHNFDNWVHFGRSLMIYGVRGVVLLLI